MIGWAGILVFLLSFLLRGGRRSILSSIALVIGAAGLLAMGIEFASTVTSAACGSRAGP